MKLKIQIRTGLKPTYHSSPALIFAKTSGIITRNPPVGHWSIVSPVPSNRARSLCESLLGPISFLLLVIKQFSYSRIPITRTLANSNQNRFPLDFCHTITVILPSVTRTLDNSNSANSNQFSFSSGHFLYYTTT